MENLIKRVLREFVESEVKFNVIGNINNLITEDINPINLNIAKEVISRNLRRINPFQGNFIDKKTGKSKIVNFTISPTKHYIERLFRLSEPEYQVNGKSFDPKIVNPEYLEGIDLLYSNRDKLAEQILIGRIKDGDVVQITAADGSNYHMIVKFFSQHSDLENFNLILFTQIKGVEFFDKKYNNKLRLFPNTTKQ